jgi:ADP-dependent NAD(P)H-hydrate dehydratase
VPEASVLPLPGLDDADAPGRGTEPGLDRALGASTTVLLGPGLDNPDDSERLLRQTLAGLPGEATLVLDAFALGVLPGIDGVRDAVGGRLVLTPNHAEAARLLDSDEDELPDDDDHIAAAIAERYGAAVSFSDTVAAGDRTWSVPSGHAGLGTSGSGDVLAGAAAGLLARGADPAQAACWATYLHATAGDRLAPRVGRLGFLARELVDELPRVLVQTEA